MWEMTFEFGQECLPRFSFPRLSILHYYSALQWPYSLFPLSPDLSWIIVFMVQFFDLFILLGYNFSCAN